VYQFITYLTNQSHIVAYIQMFAIAEGYNSLPLQSNILTYDYETNTTIELDYDETIVYNGSVFVPFNVSDYIPILSVFNIVPVLANPIWDGGIIDVDKSVSQLIYYDYSQIEHFM